MDKFSDSIDSSLAETARLLEGMARRRDSLARQMEATAQAVARISGVCAQQAPSIVLPMTKCTAPGVRPLIDVVSTQIPDAAAESSHEVVASALIAPLLLKDQVPAVGALQVKDNKAAIPHTRCSTHGLGVDAGVQLSEFTCETTLRAPMAAVVLNGELKNNTDSFSKEDCDGLVTHSPTLMNGLFGLQLHAETCLSQCNFCGISISRKDAKAMQLSTDHLFDKMPAWRRNGFSHGYYKKPHLERMPSWMYGGFSPRVFAFIFITQSVRVAGYAEAEQLSLSLNALSGTDDGDTVRIRALVQNQVMLLLVDTGSSHSFVSSAFLNRVKCPTIPIPAVAVRVANDETMHCDQMVQKLEWWTHGETFAHDMRILPLGAYDAILGMDWLKLQGDMVCNWTNQTLKFRHNGKEILLQGIQQSPLLPLQEVPIEQMIKWKGIPATSATWEDLYVLKNRFPDALAWGQASSSAGGDVTT